MNFNINFLGKMIKNLFIIVLMLSVFCLSANAVLLTTNPSDSSDTTITSSSYEIVVDVQNDNLDHNLSNVQVGINIDSDSTGLSINSNSVNLGTMNTFFDDTSWSKQVTFNLTFALDSDKDFNLTVTVSSDEDSDVSSSFTLSYDSLNEPNIYVESSDVSTIALDEFDLPIIVYNNGTGDKTIPFNVSVEYDDTLFDFVECSDSLTCDDSTSGKVVYEVSNVDSNDSFVFNMTFNATDDKGYSYNDDMKISALTSTIYPTVTINPIPVYEVNITQIYNSSTGIIDILTNNLNVVIPVKVRNIGNEILSSLNIVALVEGADLGETSVSNLSVGAYSSPSYSYEFGGEGLYNVTVNVTGSNNVTDFDFKILNISFSFNDSDGDGYFALANGGLDCNNNNASIYPGAPEICGDGIDQDCNGVDKTCSSGGGGGSHRDDDDDEEVVPPTEKNVTIEENGAVVETLLVNVPLNFEISSLNEEHSITLLQISDGYVAFEIRSEPISVILAEGESEDIDVDRDGFNDITLTVNRILSPIRAEITIEEYVEPVEVVENETEKVNESIDLGGNVSVGLNESQNNENETIEPEFGKFVDKFESFNLFDFLIIFVLAVFIILVIIGIIVRVNKRNSNEKSREKDSREENLNPKKKVSKKKE